MRELRKAAPRSQLFIGAEHGRRKPEAVLSAPFLQTKMPSGRDVPSRPHVADSAGPHSEKARKPRQPFEGRDDFIDRFQNAHVAHVNIIHDA